MPAACVRFRRFLSAVVLLTFTFVTPLSAQTADAPVKPKQIKVKAA